MLSENWFSDRWADIKAVTGVGQDSLGLGKNTEKGWRPKYRVDKKDSAKKYPRRTSGEDSGTKAWKLD